MSKNKGKQRFKDLISQGREESGKKIVAATILLSMGLTGFMGGRVSKTSEIKQIKEQFDSSISELNNHINDLEEIIEDMGIEFDNLANDKTEEKRTDRVKEYFERIEKIVSKIKSLEDYTALDRTTIDAEINLIKEEILSDDLVSDERKSQFVKTLDGIEWEFAKANIVDATKEAANGYAIGVTSERNYTFKSADGNSYKIEDLAFDAATDEYQVGYQESFGYRDGTEYYFDITRQDGLSKSIYKDSSMVEYYENDENYENDEDYEYADDERYFGKGAYVSVVEDGLDLSGREGKLIDLSYSPEADEYTYIGEHENTVETLKFDIDGDALSEITIVREKDNDGSSEVESVETLKLKLKQMTKEEFNGFMAKINDQIEKLKKEAQEQEMGEE